MSTAKETEKRSEEIQSLAKGLAVIKAFGADHPKLTLAEVAHATGLTRAGARRVLHTLRALGYVSNTDRYFRLEPSILELGYAYLSSQPWWRAAQSIIETLAERLDQPAAVGVIDGDSVVYVAHARPRRFESFPRSVGTRIPAATSAMGRVLLASLPDAELDARLQSFRPAKFTASTISDVASVRAAVLDAQRLGFALIDQELEVGLRTLAIPIVDRGGHIISAIGIGSSAMQFDKETFVEKYLAELRAASADITARLPA